MLKRDENSAFRRQVKPPPTVPGQEELAQLRRILDSPEFLATETQRMMLQFMVSETLAGRSRNLKGFTIATRVLGRGPDFDQATDPIVSMHASRLRRALERYYLTAGKQDSIVISVAKGTYVPVFSTRSVNGSQLMTVSAAPDTCFEDSRPSVLVRPFENLDGVPERNYLGIGFATEIAAELAQYPEIQVLQYGPEANGKRASDKKASFVIDGDVHSEGKMLKVIVRLTDTRTHELIWSKSITSAEDGQSISFQEMVARIISVRLTAEQGVIPRKMSIELSRNHPAKLTSYEAVLRYYEYDRTLLPEDFLKAFEALEQARVHEPNCGLVWTCLSRLYATIFALEIPGFDWKDMERKAILCADKGVYLAPDDQRAWGTLAFVRMLVDETASAQESILHAYELNPKSLVNMDGIGYVMTLLGDWELGPELIRQAMKHNPGYRDIVHYALWVYALYRKDLNEAYRETMNLRATAVFWYPLANAATLGLLELPGEAERFAADLLALKPDFPDRGRRLISRYIKQDEIVQQVIEGLEAAGVAVK